MSKPIIGLTTCPPKHDEYGYHTFACYIDAVIRAGGVPILLPHASECLVSDWMNVVDGLIFVGGGDIDPVCYGDFTKNPMLSLICAQRDGVELALISAALKAQKPLLGICRGLQLLNTALGGMLHQHVPDVVGDQVLHRLPECKASSHVVYVDESSQLAQLFGKTQDIEVVSFHHQAIHHLGQGLKAVAWSVDGLIEAVEKIDNPNVYAVQWHPERSALQDPLQQVLFNHIVQLARMDMIKKSKLNS